MPPKRKATSKKRGSTKNPPLLNGRPKEEWTEEQLDQHIVLLREQLGRERTERNYLQLKRDRIRSLQEETNRKIQNAKVELEKVEKDIEDDEERHQAEMKFIKQKMKHQDPISDRGADLAFSADEQEQISILLDKWTSNHHKVVEDMLLKQAEEVRSMREKFKKLLADQEAKQRAEIKQLQEEFENNLKHETMMCELMYHRYINDKKDDRRVLCETLDKKLAENIKAMEDDLSREKEAIKALKKVLSPHLGRVREYNRALAEAKAELDLLKKKTKFLPHKKGPLRIPQESLRCLKEERHELEEKFSKLRIEQMNRTQDLTQASGGQGTGSEGASGFSK